jgi:hypothetical protein
MYKHHSVIAPAPWFVAALVGLFGRGKHNHAGDGSDFFADLGDPLLISEAPNAHGLRERGTELFPVDGNQGLVGHFQGIGEINGFVLHVHIIRI